MISGIEFRSDISPCYVMIFLWRILYSNPNFASLLKMCVCVCVQVSPCLSVLSWLLFVNDTDILADACWALSYLSDGPNDKIQSVIDSGVCRRLVELLL